MAEVEAEEGLSVRGQGPSLQVHGGLVLNKGGSNKREGDRPGERGIQVIQESPIRQHQDNKLSNEQVQR